MRGQPSSSVARGLVPRPSSAPGGRTAVRPYHGPATPTGGGRAQNPPLHLGDTANAGRSASTAFVVGRGLVPRRPANRKSDLDDMQRACVVASPLLSLAGKTANANCFLLTIAPRRRGGSCARP